jgi:hypothetical protein
VTEISLKVIPDSFIVLFMTVDGYPVERQICNSTQFALPLTATMLNLTLDCLLLPRRLWIGNAYVGRCGTQQVSDAKELSKYYYILLITIDFALYVFKVHMTFKTLQSGVANAMS